MTAKIVRYSVVPVYQREDVFGVERGYAGPAPNRYRAELTLLLDDRGLMMLRELLRQESGQEPTVSPSSSVDEPALPGRSAPALPPGPIEGVLEEES